tara:strand:- start:11267 stop:12226 length:960 start_codon:yes stop_codon:yes gene_type:complete
MKIIVFKGGLGNQLFQLAFYLYLRKKLPFEKIKINSKTGFILDYKYKRKFQLKRINSYLDQSSCLINLSITFIVILDRFSQILKYFKNIKVIKSLDEFILEKKTTNQNKKFSDKKFLSEDFIDYFNLKNNIIFNGYFQYYQVVKEVLPELARICNSYLEGESNIKFSNLYKKIILSKNSVSIGIRLYEETKDPTLYSFNHKEKTPKDYNKIIKKLESCLNEPTFFIFVKEENKFTDQLEFNSKHYFITIKKGYVDPWACIKAQSLCQHHLFNNSTFYWWGCILSGQVFRKSAEPSFKSYIFASDNFTDPKIYHPDWEKF